jgi:hypothetical protein
MNGPELEWLYLRARENQVIIEVGSAYGRSSHALLVGNFECFEFGGRVYCVDYWPMPIKGGGDDSLFDEHKKDHVRKSTFLRRLGHWPNLNIIELPQHLAHPALSRLEVNMVFLDGGTANIREELGLWKKVPNKLLCGHDYCEEKYPGVVEAVDEILGRKPSVVEGGTVWYAYK